MKPVVEVLRAICSMFLEVILFWYGVSEYGSRRRRLRSPEYYYPVVFEYTTQTGHISLRCLCLPVLEIHRTMDEKERGGRMD